MGVAPRRLWGWEPREFTDYHYDGGRLVGSTVTREPEFTREQVELLLAFERAEDDRGPHGQPMSEATAQAADLDRPGGWHYRGNKAPRIDHAAKAVGVAQEAYYKRYPDAPRHGHLWYATRVDDN